MPRPRYQQVSLANTSLPLRLPLRAQGVSVRLCGDVLKRQVGAGSRARGSKRRVCLGENLGDSGFMAAFVDRRAAFSSTCADFILLGSMISPA